jgi:hypothetical protein
MLDRLVVLLATLPFLIVGLATTFWTRRLQAYWIRQCDRHPDAILWRIAGRRVRKDSYRIELRVIGIVCVAAIANIWWGVLILN